MHRRWRTNCRQLQPPRAIRKTQWEMKRVRNKQVYVTGRYFGYPPFYADMHSLVLMLVRQIDELLLQTTLAFQMPFESSPQITVENPSIMSLKKQSTPCNMVKRGCLYSLARAVPLTHRPRGSLPRTVRPTPQPRIWAAPLILDPTRFPNGPKLDLLFC